MGAAHFSICSFGDPTGYADVSPRNVHERLHQQHATRRQRKHHRHRQERMHPSTYDGRKQPISTWRSEAVTSRKPKSEISERNFAQLILAYFPGNTAPINTKWHSMDDVCPGKVLGEAIYCFDLSRSLIVNRQWLKQNRNNNNKQTYPITRSHWRAL